jgi:serine/threonine protein kinase
MMRMLSFDALGEILVQVQLLRPEQWEKVRQDLPAEADLRVLLQRLDKLRAWWAGEDSISALTAYQRKWIKRLFERDQMKNLKTALRWGDYLILDQLGEGGMGIVFKGWDVPEGRPVAIKRIKGSSTDTYRRFRREARIQKHLSHPRIAHFLKLTRFKGATLLVLEYIDGKTMSKEVKARGPIPWREAVGWILDILHALEYVHRLKIIHRDLKPSNIILHPRPTGVEAKLLDLGLAKCLDPAAMTETTTRDALTVGDALLGTFEYMAPEQWRGAEEIVPASDIYSLGCTLFFALTGGRPPFTANSLVAYCNAHTSNPPPQLSDVQPGLPPALDAIVQQMLSKDPTQRGSPSQLLKQFSNLLPKDVEIPVLPTGAAFHADTPAPFRPRQAPPPAPQDTVVPNRPAALPASPPAPEDERFVPFSAMEVHVSGVRAAWRALLARHGWLTRILFLLLVVLLIVLGLLLLPS